MIYSSEQQVIVNHIYNNELKWGQDFIKSITSIKKENRDKGELKKIHIYFDSKNEASFILIVKMKLSVKLNYS